MKKILFFLFAVFLFYVAAIYQYSALMVLAVWQLLLLLFLTVQTYIYRSRLEIAFVQKRMVSVKGEELSCELAIDYRGKLPAGCMKFDMTQSYGRRQKKMRLYGNHNNGKAAFSVKPPYCGIQSISLKRVRIYDYLLLGFAKKAVSDQMQIMVFPEEQALDVRISEKKTAEYPRENQHEISVRDIGEEIRQIREYREGDSKRQYHWKLSARMDTPLVKEYEREAENETELFLNLSDYDTASVQERDAFYTLLSALILGLLREQEQVNVRWQGEDGRGSVKMEVTEPAQCREVLMRLYCLGEDRLPAESVREESLMLDVKLCLSQGAKLLYQFSGDRLEEEIQEKQIIVVRGA